MSKDEQTLTPHNTSFIQATLNPIKKKQTILFKKKESWKEKDTKIKKHQQ
jgi:hypothetical protein